MAQGRRADPHHRDGRGGDRGEAAGLRQRLVDAGVAGLGFGLGFGHEKTPRALVTEAGKHGFPLFEVPYPVPFIAITEAVFTRVVAEQYDTLQRAVDAEHVLTRAVLEGAGVEGVARSLADVVKGWALLLDLHGMPLAATDPRRGGAARADLGRGAHLASRGRDVLVDDARRGVTTCGCSRSGRRAGSRRSSRWASREQPSQLDRIVAGHALSLFAIELAKSRAVAEAERRLQGDFFDELARGRASACGGGARASSGSGSGATRRCSPSRSNRSTVAIEPARLALAATDHCSRARAAGS